VAIISDQQTTTRRLSADYYPLLARAVATLSPGTAEQRAALYERVRQALLQQLQSIEPRLSGSEVAAELWALEQAIDRIDSKPGPPAEPRQAQQSQRSQQSPPPRQPAPAGKTLPPAPVHSSSRSRGIRIVAIMFGIGIVCFVLGTAINTLVGFGTRGDDLVARIAGSVGLVLVVLAGPPLWIAIILRRRRRMREAGLVKHRIRQFAWRRYDEPVRKEIARALDDRALMWAHFLPDHKLEAKAIAADELLRRGYEQRYIDTWHPDSSEFTVPPAPERKMSPRSYAALTRQKAVWFKIMYWAVVLLIPALLAAAAYDGVTESNLTNAPSGPPGSRSRQQEGAAFFVMLAFFVFGIASFWATGFFYRNRAARVLLLRPFGEKRMTRALKRFVTGSVGIHGYVFTLSDRNYRPSIVLSIILHLPIQGIDTIATLLLGPLLRSSPRIASIRNERKYRKLQKIMLRKFRPSSWSFICGGQAFNIRTTDPWWQMCIHMLMHSCELIVVDLSKVKEGTAWELNQLDAKGILDKCLFVVGERNVGDVEPVLQRYFPGSMRPTVYVYSDKGKLADKPAYDARFSEILTAGLAGWGR
jgi:hypothetical protein